VVAGEIVNAKGEVVTAFKTNQLGMGTLRLEKVDSNEKYQARVYFTGKEFPVIYSFPTIAGRGNLLAVSKDLNKIYLKASSNYLVDDSIFVRIACRGAIYYDVKGRLNQGSLSFSLVSSTLPEGILAFTLHDAKMRPVAERLFFNARPKSRLNITISADKESYVPREPVKLNIETINASGQPVQASLSLLVINESHLPLPAGRPGILSYLLLTADLRGEIENPAYYFTNEEERFKDLDALLLTQGWRKYKYQRDPVEPLFQSEPELRVTGKVTGGLFANKEKKGSSLTMMTFGKYPTVQSVTTDSAGGFSFVVDEYGENLNVLIQSANKAGTKKNYQIKLDKKEAPPIAFNHNRTAEEPDSIVMAYVKQSIERKKAEDAYTAATEGIMLGEVVVKSYFMTPERKKVADRFGKPKTVIEGDAIRAKEEKWSYGLYSVLLFNYPDQVRVRRYGDILYASLYNSEVTLVVIDGIPVNVLNYSLIPGIPPSEVKSFELIEYADNFRSLYCEVLPTDCGANTPVVGNVIAIYTYGGKGIFGVSPAVGIMKTAVQAFAAPKEFYAPKYESLRKEELEKPDLRSLIHWDPHVKIDSLGKATATFYNSDKTGNIIIIAEAISSDGEIGHTELIYNNRKNK
jgi:hypothetical protein